MLTRLAPVGRSVRSRVCGSARNIAAAVAAGSIRFRFASEYSIRRLRFLATRSAIPPSSAFPRSRDTLPASFPSLLLVASNEISLDRRFYLPEDLREVFLLQTAEEPGRGGGLKIEEWRLRISFRSFRAIRGGRGRGGRRPRRDLSTFDFALFAPCRGEIPFDFPRF